MGCIEVGTIADDRAGGVRAEHALGAHIEPSRGKIAGRLQRDREK